MRLPQDDAEERDTSPLFDGKKVLTAAEIDKRLKDWRQTTPRTDSEAALVAAHDAGWNGAIEAAAQVCDEAADAMGAIGPLGYAGAARAAERVRALKRTP